mgnify:CR=1 FL=1
MRILQLTPKPNYPPRDGGALAALHFVEMWLRLGWQVETLAMSTPKHPAPSQSPIPQKSVFVDTTPRPWPALKNLLLSSRPYHVDRFWSPAYRAALQETISTFRPDLIQVESPYLTPYVKTLSIPRTYRLHNIEHLIWARLAREKPWPLRAYLSLQARRIRQYESQILSLYQGLLPISEKEMAFVRETGYTGLVEMMPYAMDVDAYEAPPLRKEHPHIGFIGGLDWLPNLAGIEWFLRRVWPTFARRHPEAQLSIAGRNCPPHLHKYASPQVHILGEVPDSKAFLYDIDILIVPLFSGSGIRIKIIEGWAAGRAIISTSIGAESLIYEPGRHLLLADNEESFLEAVEALYIDYRLRQRIAQNGRHLAETMYNRDSQLSRFQRFYERVVHG